MGYMFYFNTEDGHRDLDPDGIELANGEQARQAVLDLACGDVNERKRPYSLERQAIESVGH